MQAEIVTIGTELLLGKIEDTNATYIAEQLIAIGLDLYCKTTVGDHERRITSILQQALARSDVVITSGGLGPTANDCTRQAVARVAGRELVLDKQLLARLEARPARHDLITSEDNHRQAHIPQGAMSIGNNVGTAPAFIVETEQGLIISLPGVPQELERLMNTWVIPLLRERLQTGQLIIRRETPLACPEMTWVETEETSEAPEEEVTLPLSLKLTIPDSRHDVEVPLIKEEVSIGRLDPASGSFPDVDLTAYDAEKKGVSRRHAKITKRGGEVFIADLGSINGTFLNGKKLSPYVFQTLKSGDKLQLSTLELQVSFDK
jgi:molybdenum cofactor synthesis domain-containing protein